MNHLNRWDEWDEWDKRPISPITAILTLAFIVAIVWGVLALTSPSPPDDKTSMINVEQSLPIPYGTKIWATGSGDLSLL